MSELLGKAEKKFIRALVSETGLEKKTGKITIKSEQATNAQYFARASKDGTVVEVAIRIDPAESWAGQKVVCCSEKSPRSRVTWCAPVDFDFLSSGDQSYKCTVSADIVSNNGSANEVLVACLNDARGKVKVPSIREVFDNRDIVHEDIFSLSTGEGAARDSSSQGEGQQIRDPYVCRTYGVVDDQFFSSPSLKEEHASDVLVHVTSKGGTIHNIKLEGGALGLPVLEKLLSHHVMQRGRGHQ